MASPSSSIRASRSIRSRQKYLALAVLLLPSLLGMFTFLMLPIASSFVLSFSSWDLIGDIEWVGLANYAKALGDPAVLGALRNTLAFILGYLPAVVVLALGLALLLNRNSAAAPSSALSISSPSSPHGWRCR
jgi:ABC-type sugar transport system permease subunit